VVVVVVVVVLGVVVVVVVPGVCLGEAGGGGSARGQEVHAKVAHGALVGQHATHSQGVFLDLLAVRVVAREFAACACLVFGGGQTINCAGPTR
jgi:hypothetical protein